MGFGFQSDGCLERTQLMIQLELFHQNTKCPFGIHSDLFCFSLIVRVQTEIVWSRRLELSQLLFLRKVPSNAGQLL
jgi:hypothetical protein